MGRGQNSAKICADRPPQILGDGARHGLVGKRADVVLQVGERGGDVVGHEIGARAHDLPDLDEGGAQVAKEVEQALAEPRPPAGSTGEDQQQNQPTHEPAQPLSDDQGADGQGPQQETVIAETSHIHRLGYDCSTTAK